MTQDNENSQQESQEIKKTRRTRTARSAASDSQTATVSKKKPAAGKKAETASPAPASVATEAETETASAPEPSAPRKRRTTRKKTEPEASDAGTAAAETEQAAARADKAETVAETPQPADLPSPRRRRAVRSAKKDEPTEPQNMAEGGEAAPAEAPAAPEASSVPDVPAAEAQATGTASGRRGRGGARRSRQKETDAPIPPVETGEAPETSSPASVPEEAQPTVWPDDEGVVRHILPPLPGMDGQDALTLPGQDRHRRSKRRPRGRGRNDMAAPAPYQPDMYDGDQYASSVLSAVLPRPDAFADDLDDDGPQPMLPGQPSLALPAAALDEEDLDALDEKINGNRIDADQPPRGPREGRDGRKGRTRRDSGRDAGRKPGRTADAAKQTAPASDDTPARAPSAARRVLYVSVVPDEQVEVVITEDGMVTEYFVEMAHQAKIRGNIYKGVVNNIDTNLQAAFVNFGGGKNGFLQIDEVHPEYWLAYHDASKGPKYPPIQKVMKVGQEVLVQVVKEPAGTKGAFLTTWVSLAGRFLVLTPGQEQIGVSRKVEDPEERSRLKELLAGIDPGEDMGVIIRTASEGASKTSIQKDWQYLKRLWKDIRKRVVTEKAPSLIYQEADLAARAVRDYLAEDIQEIWVDDEKTLEAIRETTSLLFPRRTDMLKLHRDPRHTLWERFNLQRQLEEVTSREVILPSGGRLVFDQTEALMAIDINSGKTQGKTNFEAMVFRTNMEAAEAIARHLRLRDIGGQVVIDFIEMRDRAHCREVEKAMRNAMRLDRARHDVGHMSSFGLLELVRQRTGTSAISISSEPCPHCHGTGVRRNMEWQALHALRDVQARLAKAADQDNGKNGRADKAAVVHELDYELGLYLLNKKRDRLSELESRYGLKVEIRLKG